MINVSKLRFVKYGIGGQKRMCKIYGYARISTKLQNIERQVRNILKEYPEAIILKEVFTGTKFYGRKELEKVLNVIQPGDTLVFDSVSRMSRNADEGVKLYQMLFLKGVSLVFLKEKHINTDTYKKALKNQIGMTGTPVDTILEGINKYLMILAEEQIRIAFAQAEKEVEDLHKRTSEGLQTARLNGKQIGQRKGATLHVKKKEPKMREIKKYSRDFDGTLNDMEVMRLIGLSRNTYYKYKKELRQSNELFTVQEL